MARLLLVDDDGAVQAALRHQLERDGHQTLEVADATQALRDADSCRPDLVLLDVATIGRSGEGSVSELIAQLKASAGEEFLPVLLLSSRHDAALGGDDFLTTPINADELRARVNNLLALRAKDTQLNERNRQTRELSRFRDEMSALLVHDLKNPVSIVLANLEFLAASPALDIDERGALADARLAAHRTLRLLANLLDVTRSDTGRLEVERKRTSLRAVVAPVLDRYVRMADARRIRLELDVAPDVELPLDEDLMTRVLENILDNSLRYTPEGGRLHVGATPTDDDGYVQFTIGNSGPPIPAALRERIFDKFAQAEPSLRRSNIGLGLYFCRLVAEGHGGRIHVEERRELPTTFVLTLPSS